MADPGEQFDAVLEGVGDRLRSLRSARGDTLAAVAAATGISVSTLSRLEAGGRRPTLELLLPLARRYGVPLGGRGGGGPPPGRGGGGGPAPRGGRGGGGGGRRRPATRGCTSGRGRSTAGRWSR